MQQKGCVSFGKKRRISSENGKRGRKSSPPNDPAHTRRFRKAFFPKAINPAPEKPSVYNVENPFLDNENGSITPSLEEFGF